MERVVSVEQLEPHKENIESRKGGRSAKSLVASLDGDREDSHHLITRSLEDAVALANDSDDPLAAHWALLQHLKASTAQNPKKLAKVLENAARAFRKDPRYANDTRFLSIWIQVAKTAPEPEDVFKYLSTNGIGLACATYYEEYALLLELRGRFKEADKVFIQGISLSAMPLDRLRRKYESFQQRMMVPQKSNDRECEQAEELAIQRPTLGATVSSSRRKVPPQPPSEAPMPMADSTFTSFSSYSANSVHKTNSFPAAPTKLTVFKDESTPSVTLVPTEQEWADYGTRKSQTKENSIQPEPWNQVRLPQQEQKTASLSTQPRLQVFADKQLSPVKSRTLSKHETTVLAPSGMQDSSQHIKSLLSDLADSPASAVPSELTRSNTPPIRAPIAESNLIFKFNFKDVYCNDQEFSFEEIRARKMPPPSEKSEVMRVAIDRLGLVSQNATAPQTKSSPVEAKAPKFVNPVPSEAAFDSSDEDEDAEADRELERMTKLNTFGNNISLTPSGSTNLQHIGFTSKAKAAASPTINTKAALADVYNMFNAKLPREECLSEQQQPFQQKESQEDSDEVGDVVVSVKTGLDNKPEWYDIEADETISKRVIQPCSFNLKSAIFVDAGDGAIENQSAIEKLGVSEEKNTSQENDVPKKRKPLGVKDPFPPKPATPVVDVQSPFFHDETIANCPPPLLSSPSISSANPMATAVVSESQPLPLKPLKSKPLLHSTPYHHDASLDEDSLHLSEYEQSVKTHEIQFSHPPSASHYYRLHQFKDVMTPITETSFEYEHRTAGGLSTIGSVRYEDFTMTTSGRISGELRESILSRTVVSKKVRELNLDSGVVHESLSSISLASTREELSSVDMSSSIGEESFGREKVEIGKLHALLEDKENEEDTKDVKLVENVTTSLATSGLESIKDETSKKPMAQEAVEQDVDNGIVNPCNPNSVQLHDYCMKKSDMPVSQMSGYINVSKVPSAPKIGNMLDIALAKSANGGICEIQFGPSTFVRFRVIKRVSETVTSNSAKCVSYLARDLKSGLFAQTPILDEEQELENDDEEDDLDEADEQEDEIATSSASRQFVLQVHSPASEWEFYALKTLRFRLPDRILSSIPNPISCHVFSDVSCIRTEFCSDMSIMEAIYRSKKHMFGAGLANGSTEGGVEELLCAFWTIEILRTLEAVHMSGFLHGNVSPANVLVRLGRAMTMTGVSGFWDTKYDPSGCGGWAANGVMIVGFSRAVDLFAFPEDQLFVQDSKEMACWEILNGKPYKYEPDWFGVANVVHWMLFGHELTVVYETKSEGRPIGRIGMREFKRSWQVSMWEKLFDVLLNLENSFVQTREYSGKDEEFADFAREFPPALKIREIRTEMEQWLVGACSKAGKSLKSMLQRVEMASLE